MENKGFELNRFTEQVDAYFICGFCKFIVRDPLECKICECLFCKKCQQGSCTNKCEPSQFGDPGKFARLVYEKLQLKCKFQANGCEWFAAIGETLTHEQECLFEIVACENPICTNQFMKKEKVGQRYACSVNCNYVIDFKDVLSTQDTKKILAEFCKYLDIIKTESLQNIENKDEGESTQSVENLQTQIQNYQQEISEIKNELEERKKKYHIGKFNLTKQKWTCCEGEKFVIGCREF